LLGQSLRALGGGGDFEDHDADIEAPQGREQACGEGLGRAWRGGELLGEGGVECVRMGVFEAGEKDEAVAKLGWFLGIVDGEFEIEADGAGGDAPSFGERTGMVAHQRGEGFAPAAVDLAGADLRDAEFALVEQQRRERDRGAIAQGAGLDLAGEPAIDGGDGEAGGALAGKRALGAEIAFGHRMHGELGGIPRAGLMRLCLRVRAGDGGDDAALGMAERIAGIDCVEIARMPGRDAGGERGLDAPAAAGDGLGFSRHGWRRAPRGCPQHLCR
jgi:hypothetical protein